MTDPKPETDEAREAQAHGERPDLGQTPDALKDSLTGSDVGSDTRAGSLRGGSASGSDDDPDQDTINEALATEGMASAPPRTPADPDPVNNTGDDAAKNGDEADMAGG